MRALPASIGTFLFVVALTTVSALMFPYTVNAASCGLLPTGPANVSAKTGPGVGQITVSWNTVPHADRYAVVYGTQSNQYLYGGDPIGNAQTTWNTINALKPGTTYHFRLIAKKDGCSSPWSAEVSAQAGANTAVPPAQVMVGEPMDQSAAKTMGPMKAGPVGKQSLWAKSGPGVGQATLYWKDADSANNYHLMYGTTAQANQYGALNIGNVHSFTVSSLVAGKTYHFSLVPLFNGRPLPATPTIAVMAMAPMPAEIKGEASAVLQPQSYVAPEQQQVNADPQTTMLQHDVMDEPIYVEEAPLVMQQEPMMYEEHSVRIEDVPTNAYTYTQEMQYRVGQP